LFLHGTDQKAIRVSNRKFTFLSYFFGGNLLTIFAKPVKKY